MRSRRPQSIFPKVDVSLLHASEVRVHFGDLWIGFDCSERAIFRCAVDLILPILVESFDVGGAGRGDTLSLPKTIRLASAVERIVIQTFRKRLVGTTRLRKRRVSDQVESQHLNRRRTLHRFFELGILIKGIDGGLELVGGLLLLFLAPATISGILFFLVRGELKEDPTDLIANLLLHSTGKAIQAKLSASAFLIVHGAVKLLLVVGLAANRLWSYPTAIAMFAGFTIYQIFQLWHQSSLFLGTVTVLDIVVVLLVFGEYRRVKMVSSPCALKAR